MYFIIHFYKLLFISLIIANPFTYIYAGFFFQINSNKWYLKVLQVEIV